MARADAAGCGRVVLTQINALAPALGLARAGRMGVSPRPGA